MTTRTLRLGLLSLLAGVTLGAAAAPAFVASYPTAVKTFTTKLTTDVVQASHINDLQDEVVAIEQALIDGEFEHNLSPQSTGDLRTLGTSAKFWDKAFLTNLILGAESTSGIRLEVNSGIFDVREGDDSALAPLRALTLEATSNATVGGALTVTGDVLTTAWTDYAATSTITGWSSFTTDKKNLYYKRVGKLVFVYFYLQGTSNSTTTSFTLPVASATVGDESYAGAVTLYAQNNGAFVTGLCLLFGGSSTVTCYSATDQSAWTASGTKAVSGQFWYEAAS